ncbi:hypothetical protein GSI_04121 [Ganoderma sinense ZZ0214-1]|uniref:GHMP kinase N-terminal domain-containing protein n=1 Tax=Ganoderma sinense ZZ0214-1 TaxID=1077348 RepID=A0A2G8SIX3_9APHY|nr:hypothetical protein GSI_04121 [Ganoderma sinense ZZ0214-1]
MPTEPHLGLTTRVVLYVRRCHGIAWFPSTLTLHCTRTRPGGLGSSGAGAVVGVLLCSELGQLHLPRGRTLDFALMVERHPDNVTAASLLGGFVGSYLRELEAAVTEAKNVSVSYRPAGIGYSARLRCAGCIRALTIVTRSELGMAVAGSIFNLRLAVVTTAPAQSSPDPGLVWEAVEDQIY